MTRNAQEQNTNRSKADRCTALSDGCQKGMAVLAIVAILLGVITLATVSTTQHVQQFYVIEKTRRTTENTQLALIRHVKEISKALRTQSALYAVNSLKVPDVSTTVKTTQLEGNLHQRLTHFKVSASHNTQKMYFSASFLKYPALLKLPSTSQQFSWSSDITQWMFNREIHQLSAHYFPESTTDSKCEDLESTGVQWIEGDCTLDYNDVDHINRTVPMLLIVVNGNVTINPNAHFYGLIMMLSTTQNTYTLNVSNSASIEGTYVSNRPINTHVNGTVTPSNLVLQNLQAKSSLAKIIPIPGTLYDAN